MPESLPPLTPGARIRRILSASILLSCSGCLTAQYGAGKALPERPSLEGTKVVIVTPADGADARPKTYAGSGRQTAEAIAAALAKRGASANLDGAAAAPVDPYAFYTNSLKRPAVAAYRVTPTIERWSDHVTEWSGISDELKIRVVVTDPAGKTVDDRIVTARSKWWTFGGDHPQEMLVDLFGRWADKVFAPPAKK